MSSDQGVEFVLTVQRESGKLARELVGIAWEEVVQRAAQEIGLVDSPDRGSPLVRPKHG
jgi:hypothetical protein